LHNYHTQNPRCQKERPSVAPPPVSFLEKEDRHIYFSWRGERRQRWFLKKEKEKYGFNIG